ncbi:hypothetical protein COO60DRAFT_9479 [Scenedesmus sp. NREL 46B-D3]|nr:hypothetical protein COO60DRAFT_9479 [Scenedesmus sp. NREL 46B-D3]
MIAAQNLHCNQGSCVRSQGPCHLSPHMASHLLQLLWLLLLLPLKAFKYRLYTAQLLHQLQCCLLPDALHTRDVVPRVPCKRFHVCPQLSLAWLQAILCCKVVVAVRGPAARCTAQDAHARPQQLVHVLQQEQQHHHHQQAASAAPAVITNRGSAE